MNRYITTTQQRSSQPQLPQQLFDAPEWLKTASQTAQDIEHLYNVLAPGATTEKPDTTTGGTPTGGTPDDATDAPGQNPDPPDKSTDYTPYMVAGGMVLLGVTIWWVLNNRNEHHHRSR